MLLHPSLPRLAWPRLTLVMSCAAAALLTIACEKLPTSVEEPDVNVFDTSSRPDGGGDSTPLEDTWPDAPEAIDVVVAPHIEVRFDPQGDGFYRVPWPSDARLTDAGTPDLSDFPSVGDTLLVPFRAEIERDVRGYSTMPVTYVALEPMGVDTLTDDILPAPLDTLATDSPIQLIDLSEQGCGSRVPVEVLLNHKRDRFLPENVLQIAPEIGAILSPATTYGVVVLRSFGSPLGLGTERPEGFDSALSGGESDPFSMSLEPLRRCAAEGSIDLSALAVATVFTTQDPLAQTRRLHDFIMNPDQVEVRPLTQWRESEAWTAPDRTKTYVGLAQFPIFQDGELPYNEGGGLVFDPTTGDPQIQRWEEVPIAVTFPYDASGSTEPLPVAVFLDGTGWSPWFHLYGRWAKDALAQNFAIVSFMPQFHGGRGGYAGEPEVPTFNFLNPPSGRSNFRQQAAEAAYFVRVLNEEIIGRPELPPLDTSRLVYGGHSQGAIIGALLAAIDDQFEAFVLNGLSSYLSLTVVHRKDILDFEGLIKLLLQINRDELDRHYPIMHLIQLGADVIDSHNYVTQWRGWEANPDGNNVFVINGLHDETTAQRGMDQLTLAGDLPIIDTPGWNIDPVGIGQPPHVTIPVQSNVSATSGSPLTIATWLQGDTGHFTIFDKPGPRELAIRFWTSALEGPPSLYHGVERVCGDGADNDNDQLIDCEDQDCAAAYPCVERFCDDQTDDDGNGLIDCADPECAGTSDCQEYACDDQLDDDLDGLVDCDDPDCDTEEPCVETACHDQIDADKDGLTDCDDPDCVVACTESCSNGDDDDLDGLIDCDDPDCLGSVRCPEVLCDDGVDNDIDGFFDCADFDCIDHDACLFSSEALCDDGLDDDQDGLTDCQDPSCALTSACPDTVCADADLGSRLGLPLATTFLDIETVELDYPNRYRPGACVPYGHGEFTPDVVFNWTAPETRSYTFTSHGTDFDTVLALYPAECSQAEELEIACDDDDWPRASSLLTHDLAAGESVVVVISPYDTDNIVDDASSAATRGRVVLSIY